MQKERPAPHQKNVPQRPTEVSRERRPLAAQREAERVPQADRQLPELAAAKGRRSGPREGADVETAGRRKTGGQESGGKVAVWCEGRRRQSVQNRLGRQDDRFADRFLESDATERRNNEGSLIKCSRSGTRIMVIEVKQPKK